MSFEHTRHALSAMRLRSGARLLFISLLAFAGWCGWLFFGTVSVYVKSTSARLEVAPASMPINAPVAGVVAECRATLGQNVHTGDLLLRLESRSFELQVAEANATLKADEAVLAGLKSQLSVERDARDVMTGVVASTRRAGEARVEANREASRLKQQETDMITKLADAELAPKLESLHSVSDTEERRLQIRVSSVQAALDTSTAKMTLEDRNIRVANLAFQVVSAENALQVETAKLNILEYEVERRSVRALADGVLTDAVACAPGMTVTAETRIGTLLPPGEVRVVAYFEPRDVVGRVKPGQPAIIRVENFPWTQYGTLQGAVRQVGSEPRDGLVRVELGVEAGNADIPALHGLVAAAEVRTERLSPARLLLRMAGQQVEHAKREPVSASTPASVAEGYR